MSDICFYTDSDIVKKVYRENSNYKVEFDDKKDMSCCAVYFSSNGLYYPNDEQTFTKEILDKDKYEWYKTRVRRASKHIYVRDVHKEWYLSGINGKVSDLQKLKEWLNREIQGYNETIFVGSSAGAWCAMLMGYWLDASMVMAFSPQISLDIERNSCKDTFPYLHEFSKTNQYEYFNLADVIKDGRNILWFYPSSSPDDKMHYVEGCKIPNINVITVKTPYHGVFLSRESVCPLVNMNKESLMKMAGKHYSYLGINIRLGGADYVLKLLRTKEYMEKVLASYKTYFL